MPALEMLADLRAIVGEQGLVTGERLSGQVYEGWLGPMQAQVLVQPANTLQVSQVLRLCHARGQRVVPQGGLTGLVFGASTGRDELALSTWAMDKIEAVDVAGRSIRVEAGVTLQRVQEEAERANLMFALDLGARDSASIGGNIATNAGGMRVVRYGMMRTLVLGLEAVLADGTVLCSLNRMLKNK